GAPRASDERRGARPGRGRGPDARPAVRGGPGPGAGQRQAARGQLRGSERPRPAVRRQVLPRRGPPHLRRRKRDPHRVHRRAPGPRAGDVDGDTVFDKTPLETTLEDRLPAGLGGRCYGVYPALVSDVVDPDGIGRVKVKLPWAADASSGRYEAWARVAT